MTWYTGNQTYDTVLTFAFVSVAVAGAFIKSPYGRFASDKYGLSLGPRFGWFLMELPATLSFVYFYFQGKNRFEIVPLFFLAVWLIHYGNRGFVFPYLIRSPKGAKGTFNFGMTVTGWFVTATHGYLNARFISELGTHYTVEWLKDPRFIIGIVVYYVSFFANLHSDSILRNLRSKTEIARGEKVYRIPKGGLFKWVTNPSYLTEITSFAGFAMATWCLGSCFVLLITLANLDRIVEPSMVQRKVPRLSSRAKSADAVFVLAAHAEHLS